MRPGEPFIALVAGVCLGIVIAAAVIILLAAG